MNGILEPQSIVDKQQLIDEAKDVQGEEGRNCARGAFVVVGVIAQPGLESCEYITLLPISCGPSIKGFLGIFLIQETRFVKREHLRFESQHYGCLDASDADEGPCPQRPRGIHLKFYPDSASGPRIAFSLMKSTSVRLIGPI